MSKHKGILKGVLMRIELKNGNYYFGFFDRFQQILKEKFIVLDISNLPTHFDLEDEPKKEVGRGELFIAFYDIQDFYTIPKKEDMDTFLKYWREEEKKRRNDNQEYQ